MKKIFALIALTAAICSCVNDDQYTWEDNFADKTGTDTITISIAYNGSQVVVTGDSYGYVAASGANVTVKSASNRFLQLVLSGSSDNGSLLLYSWKKLGVVLNGISLHNENGPAINNQCGKSFIITTAAGTTNTLSDGATYADAPINEAGDTIDQKATIFSEGQIYLRGTGILNINAKAKNAIASDDYITIEGSTINIDVASTGSNGIKANDGVFITGGTTNISVAADGARGIRSEARTTISGGTTAITTSGDCKIEMKDGVADTTACAGIKSDSLLVMTGGSLSIVSTGDGGKGINCSQDFNLQGGQLVVTTTGTKNLSKPHAVKADGNIVLSGGSAYLFAMRKALSTDMELIINGGTLLAVGKKESVPSSTSTQSYKSYDEDDEIDAVGGEQLTVDGISFTVPAIFNCSDAYVLTSSSDM